MKFEMMEDRALEWAKKKLLRLQWRKEIQLIYTVAIRYIVYFNV